MKIEKGVPLPGPIAGPPRKYPFPDMEVGDSFAVPLSGEKTEKYDDRATSLLRGAALNYGRRTGMEFVVRTVREEGVARCWRTA